MGQPHYILHYFMVWVHGLPHTQCTGIVYHAYRYSVPVYTCSLLVPDGSVSHSLPAPPPALSVGGERGGQKKVSLPGSTLRAHYISIVLKNCYFLLLIGVDGPKS